MDSLFENSYIRSKEMLKEVYRSIFFKEPILIVFDVLLGVVFISNVVCLIMEYTSTTRVLFIAPIYYLLRFIQYSKAVNIAVKRDDESTNGMPLAIDTAVSNQEIVTTTCGFVNRISLDRIHKVIETKNLIFLLSEAKIIYIFPKDSFTKGSPNEFLNFFKQNGF